MAVNNTLLLRLDGPFQAWGLAESRFLVRRVAPAPTKSGVIGLLCAAMGIARPDAVPERLKPLTELRMAVRIDRPGIRWLDYHTVGSGGISRRTAGGGLRHGETMLTIREYLGDASFLVALWGEPSTIDRLYQALLEPVWPLYLGRKSCVPALPVVSPEGRSLRSAANPLEALAAEPWKPRYGFEKEPETLTVYSDWPLPGVNMNVTDLDTAHDVPVHFIPPAPAYISRTVARLALACGDGEDRVPIDRKPQFHLPEPPQRFRADYTNAEYRKVRVERLSQDHGLCVFCKAPATTVQHITYRNAGGRERIEELRALCRLCHDACTMIEYGYNMGMDRIDPEDPDWRDLIIHRRQAIIQSRSRKTRARLLNETVK